MWQPLLELPDELTAPFFTYVCLLARATEEGLAAEGSFVAMNNRVSQSVPPSTRPHRPPPQT